MTLLIATPIRGGELESSSVTMGWADALRMVMHAMPATVRYVFALDVVRARNRVVGDLLRNPDLAHITHVLWWDDDNWPKHPGIIAEMMRLDLPIVGIPYTNKRRPRRWIHQDWPDREPEVDADGLLDVMGCGMGFTLVSRTCLTTMAAHAEHYWDLPNKWTVPNIFGQLYDEIAGCKVLLSEDFSFCKRWRENHGGKVKMLMKSTLMYHAGPHAWSAQDPP